METGQIPVRRSKVVRCLARSRQVLVFVLNTTQSGLCLRKENQLKKIINRQCKGPGSAVSVLGQILSIVTRVNMLGFPPILHELMSHQISVE